MSIHENLKRFKEAKTSSNKGFCLTFFAFFGLLSLYAHLTSKLGLYTTIVLEILSLAFLLVGLIKPSAAALLNNIWGKLGLYLSKITLPLILGVIYFIPITCTALFFRLIRRDVLKLSFQKKFSSYWESPIKGKKETSSFRNQF